VPRTESSGMRRMSTIRDRMIAPSPIMLICISMTSKVMN
jgi:hypothetical protein